MEARGVTKLEDIIGLYMNPPEHAVVWSIDEKSQIQALDRTQPGLPLKRGSCGTMTHDYKRNGTTTLFAATTAGCIAPMLGSYPPTKSWGPRTASRRTPGSKSAAREGAHRTHGLQAPGESLPGAS